MVSGQFAVQRRLDHRAIQVRIESIDALGDAPTYERPDDAGVMNALERERAVPADDGQDGMEGQKAPVRPRRKIGAASSAKPVGLPPGLRIPAADGVKNRLSAMQ